MRIALILTAMALGLAAAAHALDFNALQQQLMANPAVQQRAQLAQQVQAIAARVFTPAEQSSLNAFTATPEGQGIVAKLPQFAQQLLPVLLKIYAGQAAAAAGN